MARCKKSRLSGPLEVVKTFLRMSDIYYHDQRLSETEVVDQTVI